MAVIENKAFRLVGSSQEENVDDWTLDGEEMILDASNLMVGITGVSIDRIEQTDISEEGGGKNEVSMWLTNGKAYKFYVRNGKDGKDGEPGKDGKDGSILYPRFDIRDGHLYAVIPATEAEIDVELRDGHLILKV